MSYPKQPSFQDQSLQTIIKNDLMQALDQNSVHACLEVLKHKPNLVNEKGFNDMTPLHNSCLRGMHEITEVLLEHGGNPNARTAYEETPLHYACRRGAIRVIHLLIEAGADVTAVDKQGGGCMHFAALGGSILAIHYLSERTSLQFDTGNYAGDTVLHISCDHRHMLLVQYLLRKSRSDPLIQNNRGQTALHVAARLGDRELCWRLVVVGRCKLSAIEDHEGNRAVDIAKREVTDRHKGLAKELAYYTTLDPNTPPKGPIVTWTSHLLLPFTWAGATFVLSSRLNGYSGAFAIFMFVLLVAFVGRQRHRMNHSSRWPNPIYLGGFAAGIVHCIIAATIKLIPGLWPCPFTLLLVVTLWITCARYMYNLVYGDPGVVKHGKMSVDGRSLGIVDIARGICNDSEFCVYTEIIKPEQCKYCRLCETLVQGLDHHCLFLNNCVAKLNHRSFVLFILNVMLLQILFIFEALMYASSQFDRPLSHGATLISLLFKHEPWIVDLIALCVVTLLWETPLILGQLANIAVGQTEYYKRAGVKLTKREALINIGKFFFNPKQGSQTRSVTRESKPLLSV